MRRLLEAKTLATHGAALPRWLWARERRWWLFCAAGLAALATFVEISEELIEDAELSALDVQVLQAVSVYRLPWLTISFIDITALGSLTLLAVSMLCAAVPLVRVGDRLGAIQLLTALSGAGLWTLVTKSWFARARPHDVERLIEVQGYSFPSGHSAGAATLYVTLAMVLGRHLRSLESRVLLAVSASAMALLIGFSRVYLGVHYPSDVASGLAFGAGWAFLVTALFEWWRTRGQPAANLAPRRQDP
jgi:undecaprenyl-diphosphatase